MTPELLIGNPEIRTMQVLQTEVANDNNFNFNNCIAIIEKFNRFSKWHTALKVVTRIQQLARDKAVKSINVEDEK